MSKSTPLIVAGLKELRTKAKRLPPELKVKLATDLLSKEVFLKKLVDENCQFPDRSRRHRIVNDGSVVISEKEADRIIEAHISLLSNPLATILAFVRLADR